MPEKKAAPAFFLVVLPLHHTGSRRHQDSNLALLINSEMKYPMPIAPGTFPPTTPLP